MLIVQELCNKYGPFVNVNESSANDSIALRYSEVNSEESLVDLSSLFP